MKLILWLAAAAAVTFAAPQAANAPKYEPNENQTLRLQLKHKDAELALVQAQIAQARYNQAIADLNTEGEKVKKENNWPDETIFDNDKLRFKAPPPPKPEPPKK